jgi:outer membrane receptor protein involved in Fe transport
VEVLKGPGTALYGSDAIGGVVNVLSRPAPARPTAEVSTEGGAFGYQRLLATGGGMVGGDGVRADLNLTRVAGWRERNAYERQSGTVRWDHTGDAGLTVRAVVTGTRVDQNDAIAQDSAQFAERSALNRSPLAYRRVTALRASAAVEKTHGPTSWGLTPYVRRNVLSLLPNWQLTFDPQVYRTRSTSVGLLARARRDFGPAVGGRPAARVIAGADVDVTPGAYQADSVRLFRRGTGGATVYDSVQATRRLYDYDVTYRQASPYAQVEVSPVPALPGLRLDAGARYDVMAYAYRTRVRPTQAGRWRVPENTTRDYTRLSPKVGATYEVSPALGVFAATARASARRGRGSCSRRADGEHGGPQARQGGLVRDRRARPARHAARLHRLGVRHDAARRHPHLHHGRRAARGAERRRDAPPRRGDEPRRARRARPAPRRGLLGDAPALRDLRAAGGAAGRGRRPGHARDQLRGPRHRAGAVAARQRPAHVEPAAPARRARGGGVHAHRPLRGRLPARRAGLPADAVMYGGHQVWSLHANAQLLPHVELFGRVTNLTDRRYAELASFTANDRVQPDALTPGAPRTVHAGLRWGWSK